MNTHETLRKEIDQIDKELVKLFEKRMKVSVEIADYKVKNDIPVFDEAREKEVIERNVKHLSDESLKEYGEEFLKSMMGLSRKRQHELVDTERFSQE